MIEPMSIEVIYTAESTATGGGRDGHVKSSDNRIDLDTRPPKAMGGSGEGTNPEQLFSAGYAACFLGALRLVAGTEKIALDERHRRHRRRSASARTPTAASASPPTSSATCPGLEQEQAEDLMNKAHQVCPYSKATRGNIDVTLTAKV